MTAEKLPPWARMSLGYDDDPLVVALGQFGPDAGLSRDMHLATIRYCRRGGTDGWLPPQEPTRLAWPLPYERALAIAEHLVEVGLLEADGYDMAGAIAAGKATVMADAMAAGMANGWRVPNYDKWQETAAEVEAYSKAQAERGRLGAAKRWNSHRHGGAIALPLANDGDPMADRERDINQAAQITGPRTSPTHGPDRTRARGHQAPEPAADDIPPW